MSLTQKGVRRNKILFLHTLFFLPNIIRMLCNMLYNMLLLTLSAAGLRTFWDGFFSGLLP